MTDTFNIYGHSFQVKILSSILSDRDFLSQILDILKPEYFEADSIKWLIEQTLFYFKEYRKVPSLDVYKVQLSSVKLELLRVEIIKTLKEVWQYLEHHDLDFVKNTALDFCKNQELKNAILRSVDLLERGQYDAIKVEIDNAMKAGMDYKMGLDYLIDIDYRYEVSGDRTVIPTGWDPIDKLMKGGLPLGTFGLIMGDKGAGKSFNLVHLGAHALKLGYNVVHYTLELDENYVAFRYDAALTGIGLDTLPDRIEDVKSRLSKYEGKLIIKEFATKSVTLNALRAHLEKVKLIHTAPSLVLVDYLDLLKFTTNNSRTDEDLEQLYQEFRGFCKECGVAGWSVTQNNRTGANKEVVDADSVSGSYAKGFIADFWMALSRFGADKLINSARYNIIKNRFGPDGMVLPARIDP